VLLGLPPQPSTRICFNRLAIITVCLFAAMGIEDLLTKDSLAEEKTDVPMPAIVFAMFVVLGFFAWAASTGIFTQDYGPRALTKKELKAAERKMAKKADKAR
jgi:hypothetical protein